MKKKLIEVALPLEAINKASAREKSIRHGHPSTLHLWWARRPLAAARAVIFAQMVDDPSARTELFQTEEAQEQERQRLFGIIEDLVLWENTTNEKVLDQARAEIRKSWQRECADFKAANKTDSPLFDPQKLPAFHDPFAGGGALPLEAQRLGLESWASDLNPVAVLINKAMIEIPPKFAGRRPIGPPVEKQMSADYDQDWMGAKGLAEDVRRYGAWMRDEAEKRIGHLYPKISVTPEMVKERPDLARYANKELTVIAWLWARTVKSPNPAFSHVDVPLASTFMLSTKTGKEAYVEPVIEGDSYRFTVKVGKSKDEVAAKNGTKLSRGANFKCVMSETPIAPDYIYSEANAGRMGQRLMAIVAEGDRGRVYLAPVQEHESVIYQAKPDWKPEVLMPENPRWFSPPLYGLKTYGDLFTPRQLVALTTFSDLVSEAREKVKKDALAAEMTDDGQGLDNGGTGATAYADAVAVYLAIAIDKLSDYNSSIVLWSPTRDQVKTTFSRQAIPMTWDFAETNTFAKAAGDILVSIDGIVKVLSQFGASDSGTVIMHDSRTQSTSLHKIISTDPPYYDNIGYADLSDFFYVWLRRSLQHVFQDLFATLAVPKAEELIASPYRQGSKEKAEAFFLEGMTKAMQRLAEQAHPAFPVTIYYAFKQAESESEEGTASTGWETFLSAVINAGFSITGTWPIRTERGTRSVSLGTNALASSIILVCRKRSKDAPTATRREFLSALKAELPRALVLLQKGNIAPVDLQQAAIGPGMAIYTRYSAILDAEGKALTVREALSLINQVLDETLAEQEGDFDPETRWALAWFSEFGFDEGDYGVAEVLSKAKAVSVAGMVEAGVAASKGGNVRLLAPAELPEDWDPATDKRFTAWEAIHHLVKALGTGEFAAAILARKLGEERSATARELAYRLYSLCERKKRAALALSYNALVQSWPEIARLAAEGEKPAPKRVRDIFDQE